MPRRDATVRDALQAYVEDRAGVPFTALTTLAQPLFALNQADLRVTERGPEADEQEVASLVAVLDLARLLWAFFSLPPDEQARQRCALRTALLGEAHDDEAERRAADHLLDHLAERWHLLPFDVQAAQTEGFVLPPFSVLLRTYAGEGAPAYGPDRLLAADALARFAQPLLDAVPTDDGNALRAALRRAEVYWDAAHAPPDERAARLAAAKARLRDTGLAPPDLDDEARRMRDRFDHLFPERAGGA